jgi:hypothetical protein
MVDYNSSFKRPFSDWKKLLIGTLFNIIPIINFFAMGYILKMISSTSKKDVKKLPAWDNFGTLFFKGFMMFLIGLIYALPAIIIGVIALYPVISATIMSGGSYELIAYDIQTVILQAAPLIILAIVLAVVASYLAPIGIVNYAKKGKFSTAFEIGLILKKVFTGKYFLAWLLSMLLSIVASFFGGIVYVGWLLGAFVNFIIYIISFSIFAQVYIE